MKRFYHLISLSTVFCSFFFINGASGKKPHLFSWQLDFGQRSTPKVPLLPLTEETFAVAERNALYMRSVGLGNYAYSKQKHARLATHPDYLTNPTTADASLIPEIGKSEHPFHAVIQTSAPSAATTSRDSASGTSTIPQSSSFTVVPVSTRHESPIVSCARRKDVIATASAWHILLTDIASKTTTTFEHSEPFILSLSSKSSYCELGKYCSNNYISCVALSEKLLIGHFDGVLTVRDSTTTKLVDVVPRLPEKHYTVAPAVKEILTIEDTRAYALTDRALEHLDLRAKERAQMIEISPRDRYSSMCSGKEGTLLLGTRNGALYTFDPRTQQAECSIDTDTLGPPSSITALATSRPLIYIGTENGDIFRYNADTKECSSLKTSNAAPIVSLLPEERCLIFSTSRGTIQCLPLK